MDGKTPLLSDTEKRDWLRLIRSEHLGPVTFHNILRYYGSAAKAIEALPDMAKRARSKRAVKLAPAAAIDREMDSLRKAGARLVAWGEPDYPLRLMQLDDAPPLLAVKGRAEIAARQGIAIVGARNASAIGQRFTRDIAADLCRHDLAVISGLARGIDRAAHEGALAAGGATMAFIGTGIDVVFPPENAKLHDEIAEQGLIFAEMPPGTPPLAQNFPRRNRLISGASMGVLVIEAALKSGSLITARMAAEQGREVMAVPGSPLDPRCHGSNDLIRQGATLVERIDDILAVMAPQMTVKASPPITQPPDPIAVSDDDIGHAHGELDRLLSPSPVLIDDLIRLSGLSAALVHMALTEKELSGLLLRHPGGKVSSA